MLTQSVMKKYRILICLVHLLLEAFPFCSRRIELLLSCNSRFSTIPYPCDSSRGGIDKKLRKIICPKINFEVWKL
jgi:hypothetical protein